LLDALAARDGGYYTGAMRRLFKRPPRLQFVFESYRSRLYFVTLCTMHRRRILAKDEVHDAFRQYAEIGLQHNIVVGRYVVMPDHIHLFVCGGLEFDLSIWMRGLKRALGKMLTVQDGTPWQPGFFDHLMRSDDSYAQKWEYVRNNPVRAGLAQTVDEWPYQGEIGRIDRL
jgi:REP element-mobilizing transposase RayT